MYSLEQLIKLKEYTDYLHKGALYPGNTPAMDPTLSLLTVLDQAIKQARILKAIDEAHGPDHVCRCTEIQCIPDCYECYHQYPCPTKLLIDGEIDEL